VRPSYPSVEVTHGWLQFVGRLEATREVLDVLSLLVSGEILNRVNELGTAYLSERHCCEGQNLELCPCRLDPHDVSIDETEQSRRDIQISGLRKLAQEIGPIVARA